MYRSQLAPVSLRGQWSETIELRDDDDNSLIDLDDATIDVQLYERVVNGTSYPTPTITLSTDDDTLDVTSPGYVTFTFTSSQLNGLQPGMYELSVVVTIDDETEEIMRSPVVME